MNEPSRFARVMDLVQPFRDDATTCAPSPLALSPGSIAAAWSQSRRIIASAVAEQPRPGLFVFAHHPLFGIVGRLWLRATLEPRAGTLGRHERVDLGLPLDRALSLRHALFVVRIVDGRTRTTVVDLASSAGMELGNGRAVSRFDIEGAFALRLGEFFVFGLATGEGSCPVHVDAAAPAHLVIRGHNELAQPAARILLRAGNSHEAGTATRSELARGILIGRNSRCDLQIGHDAISRVHAVIVDIEGEPTIVDAGSTNGMSRSNGTPVRCERLGADSIWLAQLAAITWAPFH